MRYNRTAERVRQSLVNRQKSVKERKTTIDLSKTGKEMKIKRERVPTLPYACLLNTSRLSRYTSPWSKAIYRSGRVKMICPSAPED